MNRCLRFLTNKYIPLSLFILGFGLNSFSQTVRVFSTSGTFTVPACVTTITVQCWGAGGGGGGAAAASGGAAGSGGGGGGYAIATLTNVSGTYTVTVGTGGTAGNGAVTASINGGAGGNSIFTNGTVTVTGVGGGGGTGLTGAGVGTTVGQGGGGTFVGVAGTATYKGGNGALGNNQDNNTGGAGGGGAGSSGNGVTPAQTGNDANATGGAGGPGNTNGMGGSVSAQYYENGGPGYSIGGGGAGGGGETSGGIFGHGTASGNGGAGGDGEVIVSYSLATPTITSVTGSGCPGSTVTVQGTLLSGATSVTIGSTALTNLSISSTVITGTIPAGATTGVITVTTPCGTATGSSFTVHQTSRVNLGTHTICSGSYTFGGHNYTASGTYSDTTASVVTGCDSITTISLSIGTTINQSISQTVCAGGGYNFGGHTYTTSGTYTDTATSAVTGCDSITTLTLTIGAGLTQFIAKTICGDASYSFGGHAYDTSGVYSDTTSSAVSGCDSITVVRLTVIAAATSVTHGYICDRNSYTFNGVNYTNPGVYADTIIAGGANGCDSIAILNLGVASTFGETVNATAVPPVICNGDTARICATPGFAAYKWNTGDSSTCVYTTTSANYSITATDTSGCTVTNIFSISAFTPTQPIIQRSGDTLTSSTEATYQWYYDNQALAGDTNRAIIATQAGKYEVNVVDSNGCPDSSAAFNFTTGIINLQTGVSITVFPNPLASGNWSVTVSENLVGNTYEIFDADGKVIFKSTITCAHFEISPNMSKGVYILQINSAEKAYNLKLIKLN